MAGTTEYSTRGTVFERIAQGWRVDYLVLFIPITLLSWLFYDLSFVWRLSSNYEHGYAIPWLCLGILYVLWPNRPPIEGRRPNVFKGGLVWGLLLLFIPLRIVFEVNPDWRLLMWIEALLVLWVGSLIISILVGWGWVRYLSVIGGLVIASLPWPTRVESELLSHMMAFVSNRTVEILDLLGIKAVLSGDLVYIQGTVVGISEACSGLKSFQMTWVVIIVLLYFMRFGGWQRLLFVLGSVFVCLFGNLIRVLVLSLIAYNQGNGGVERWHDAVGYVGTVGVIGGVYLVGWILSKEKEDRLEEGGGKSSEVGGIEERKVPMVWLGAWTGALILSSVGSFVYYQAGEKEAAGGERIIFNWEKVEGYEGLPIDETVEEQLWFDEGAHGEIRSEGDYVGMYSFYWDKGRVSAFSTVHRPENCMPQVGYRFLGALSPLEMTMGDRTVKIHAYSFERGGSRSFYVFFMGWDLATGEDIIPVANMVDRFRAVRLGLPFGARQSLQLFVFSRDYEHARARMEKVLEAALGEMSKIDLN